MYMPRPTLASEVNLEILCSETARISQRFAPYTATARVGSLRKILSFANDSVRALPAPDSAEWKIFINEHYLYHLLHPEKLNDDGDKEFESMRTEWTQISYLYKSFKQKNIIPSDTIIPAMRQPQISGDERSAEILDSVEATLWPLTDADELWPKTFLIDRGLNLSTDQFLDTLQSDVEKRTQTILSACENYWDNVVECQRVGEDLINSISFETIEAVLASGNFFIGRRYIADPTNPDGAAWFLAVINYYFLATDELSAISYRALSKIPFFQPLCRNGYMKKKMAIKLTEIAGKYRAPTLDINETLNRLLGHLSARDCGAAAAILVAENPNLIHTRYAAPII